MIMVMGRKITFAISDFNKGAVNTLYFFAFKCAIFPGLIQFLGKSESTFPVGWRSFILFLMANDDHNLKT